MTRLVTVLILLTSGAASAHDETIRLNQVGYYPDAPKIAIVVEPTASTVFELINSSGQTVFQGKLGVPVHWAQSGETTRKADFSSFSIVGRYQLRVGSKVSWPFDIKHDAWRRVSVSIMKSYYLQRASFALDEKYAGIYKRAAGHADTAAVFHPSTGRSGQLNAPGGWYDAGDFGKYIVSAGITVANMMSLMEMIPGAYPDGSINIPESGNGISDLLDEVRYELEWFRKMQDTDGGVFVKMTTARYPDMMFPETDPLPRNVYGKSTASTLHFAASMAMASRLFTSIDPEWADECLKRAEDAWHWALNNPAEIYTNPPGVLSGAYSNSDMKDEFLWAASELFITSQKAPYKNYLQANIEALRHYNRPSWANVHGLAVMSLVVHRDALPTELRLTVETSLKNWAVRTIKTMNASAYEIPKIPFGWGSNGDMGSAGLGFVYAYQLTGERKYLWAATAVGDYLMGKNATGYSFVTGFGSKQVVNLHHSVSIADGIPGSLPGFIPGGPNPNMEDAVTDAYGEGAKYQSTLPANAYVDDILSYSSNENDICYSAPYVALIAALDYYFGDAYPPDWKRYNQIPGPES